MYGSIFNFTIKPGHEDSLLKLLNLQGADKTEEEKNIFEN